MYRFVGSPLNFGAARFLQGGPLMPQTGMYGNQSAPIIPRTFNQPVQPRVMPQAPVASQGGLLGPMMQPRVDPFRGGGGNRTGGMGPQGRGGPGFGGFGGGGPGFGGPAPGASRSSAARGLRGGGINRGGGVNGGPVGGGGGNFGGGGRY